MANFTESGFERKLAELSSTQLSIQTLSLWLVHHRVHFEQIVKIWYKEFLKAQEHRKLTFLYLANDVIQTSKRKMAEFAKAFAPVIKKALEYMARNPDDKTKKCVLRILKVWEERGIYEVSLIKEFESSYRKAWDDLHGPDVDELLEAPIEGTNKSGKGKDKDREKERAKAKEREKRKRKHHHHHHHKDKHTSSSAKITDADPPPPATTGEEGEGETEEQEGEGTNPSPAKKRKIEVEEEEDEAGIEKKRKQKARKAMEMALRRRELESSSTTVQEWEVDGVTQMEIKLSPSPYKEPPTEEELIAFIKALEKMPSQDASTRGKIANLPPEVSDPTGVEKICSDSDATRDLQNKIKSALELLKDYNVKLDAELGERKKVSMKLQDLICFQKDLLTQAEHRLEEHQQYAKILAKKIEELKSHVQSMPDLTKLPSVTDGLAPLPSAGDLFNI